MSARMLHSEIECKLSIFRSLKAGKCVMRGSSVFKAKCSTGIGMGMGVGVGMGMGMPYDKGTGIGMEGKLGLFMDLDSGRFPNGVPTGETMNNIIRRYLRVHGYPCIDSCIAYGVGSCYNIYPDSSIDGTEKVEFVESSFPSSEGEQPVEVTLKMGKKSALIEKSILTDMGAFALDSHRPRTILVCFGQFDYAERHVYNGETPGPSGSRYWHGRRKLIGRRINLCNSLQSHINGTGLGLSSLKRDV